MAINRHFLHFLSHFCQNQRFLLFPRGLIGDFHQFCRKCRFSAFPPEHHFSPKPPLFAKTSGDSKISSGQGGCGGDSPTNPCGRRRGLGFAEARPTSRARGDIQDLIVNYSFTSARVFLFQKHASALRAGRTSRPPSSRGPARASSSLRLIS